MTDSRLKQLDKRMAELATERKYLVSQEAMFAHAGSPTGMLGLSFVNGTIAFLNKDYEAGVSAHGKIMLFRWYNLYAGKTGRSLPQIGESVKVIFNREGSLLEVCSV